MLRSPEFLEETDFIMKKVATTAFGLLLTVSLVTPGSAFGQPRSLSEGGTALAQDTQADKIRKEYADYQAIHAEKDPARVVELGEAFFKGSPTETYARYVYADLNKARYERYKALKATGQYSDALKFAEDLNRDRPKEFTANQPKPPDVELYFIFDLIQQAQTDGNKLVTEKKDGSAAFNEAAKLAQRAIAAIEAGKEDVSRFDPAKKQTWADVKSSTLAYCHFVISIPLYNTKKFAEAEPEIQKALELGCKYYPNLYYNLGFIQGGRYEEKAKAYQALTEDEKKGEKGAAALKEAFAEADKASALFAKCINGCQASENAAVYAEIVKLARKELEYYYSITHEDKLDGLDAFIATQKDVCK
jgi:hypothetical protein